MPKQTTATFPEGTLLHTRENAEALSTVAGLQHALRENRTLEAIAGICDANLNLQFRLPCGIRAIMPREEVVYYRPGEDPKGIAVITRVGKPVCFKVLDVRDQDGETVAYISRKAAQEEFIREILLHFVPGDIIRACVTHLENFGAFVDVGCGVISLLSVDAISVSRIAHPKDRLTPGMPIFAVVKTVDPATERISVSMRELLGTWAENAARFHVGETVSGIVRSIEEYGVFVELAPNLAGLAELREEVCPDPEAMIGRPAAVYIKSIVPERMKIKLTLIDTCHGTVRKASPEYFIRPEGTDHLSRWRYSPPESARIIETVFDDPLPLRFREIDPLRETE